MLLKVVFLCNQIKEMEMINCAKILTLVILLVCSFCSAKEILVLGPYRFVKVLKVSYKGIQIAHKDGTGYLDLKALSDDDKKLIAAEIAEYNECLKGKAKAIAEEKKQKAKEVKDKKAADAFANAFIKAIGQPKTQTGYLLTSYAALAKRYKVKMTIPKKQKDGTLPLLYKQYEILRKYVAEKTEGSAKQKEALKLLDRHYLVYRQQRNMQITARNKKLAAQKNKKPAAKAPAKPAAKAPANPAPKPAAKPAAAPAPAESPAGEDMPGDFPGMMPGM